MVNTTMKSIFFLCQVDCTVQILTNPLKFQILCKILIKMSKTKFIAIFPLKKLNNFEAVNGNAEGRKA